MLLRSPAALSLADCTVRCSQGPSMAEVPTKHLMHTSLTVKFNVDTIEMRKNWAVDLISFCWIQCFPHSRPFMNIHWIESERRPRSVNAIYMLLWGERFGSFSNVLHSRIARESSYQFRQILTSTSGLFPIYEWPAGPESLPLPWPPTLSIPKHIWPRSTWFLLSEGPVPGLSSLIPRFQLLPFYMAWKVAFVLTPSTCPTYTLYSFW